MNTRDYACFGVAVLLLVVGTFATGFLPPSPLSQVLAGGLIVAAFALIFVCLRD